MAMTIHKSKNVIDYNAVFSRYYLAVCKSANTYNYTMLSQYIRRFIFNMGIFLMSIGSVGFVYQFVYNVDRHVSVFEYMSLLPLSFTIGKMIHTGLISVTGFALRLINRGRPSVCNTPITNRTAILFLTYNENPNYILKRLDYVMKSLQKEKDGDMYDFFVLSDSTDQSIIEKERDVFAYIAGIKYRRRQVNDNAKVGNVRDFCEKYGSEYEYMLVMDSDSLMDGNVIIEITRTIESDSSIAIAQPSIYIINSQSVFAKSHQFMNWVSSPSQVVGMNFWNCGKGLYYGHNAIMRIKPYYDLCKLPNINARWFRSLNGHVLSHDFVEAVLLSKEGYKVVNVFVERGSYEEMPPNIIDYAKRDLRWCRGNMQHLLLNAMIPNIPLHNRFQLFLSPMAYFGSFLWLLLIGASIGNALLVSNGTKTILNLQIDYRPILFSIMLILAPYYIGFLDHLCNGNISSFGGIIPYTSSVCVSLILHTITAPIFMIYHITFIGYILIGKAVHWAVQNRESSHLPFWRTLIDQCANIIIGICLLALIITEKLWLLLTICTGLVLSPIITVLTSYKIPTSWVWRCPGDSIEF